jgi:hypothetical protein
MLNGLFALLLVFQVSAVDIGGGFIDASARSTRLSPERIEVTLTVSAAAGASVVAHLIEPGGEQLTVALADDGDGRYEGTFETRPIDLVVVFEGIRSGRESAQSRPLRLTELGLPTDALVSPTFPSPEAEENSQWAWLALGAGAAALALLALAFVPKRRPVSEDQSESEPAEISG